MDRRRALGAIGGGLALGALGGCVPGGDDRANVLTLGCYSVVREAVHKSALPAFRKGRSVRFEESYASSGAQARAIASGFDADVALLSHLGDMGILAKAGLLGVRKPAIVSRSLVVVAVRPGNPWEVASFEDLARPGIQVLYPDPKTSGGAKWNLNAIWGHGLRRGGSEAAADDLMGRVQANVLSMDASGRASASTFEGGAGDALVTYEHEAILLNRRAASLGREPFSLVVPAPTLVIEGPGVVVEASVARHKNVALAEAFFAFMMGTEGQSALAEHGFRPLTGPIGADAFTIDEIGGWSDLNKKLYGRDGVWERALLRARGRRA